MTDINKPTIQDVTYSATKAALNYIPILGAAASELFGLVITPPLEKRREKWMNDVAEKIKSLENVGKIDLKKLSENDQFIDTVAQATSLALKTSENEKIIALKNAIVNTALGEAPDTTKSQIFLNLVDSFTSWHIKILHFFDNPSQWFTNEGKPLPNFAVGSIFSVLISAFPSLQGQDELADLIWKDLLNAGLHQSSDLKTTMSGNGALAARTTELGKEFIHFITAHS